MRATTPGRLVSLIGGLVSSSLLIAGCSNSTPPKSETATGSLSSPASPARLAPQAFGDVYGQRVSWHPCDLTADGTQLAKAARRTAQQVLCGTVEVPLDWAAAGSTDRIELALMKLPATGSHRLGALLMNPGGPGEPGMTLPLSIAASSEEFKDVESSYDLIGFDPRGIGESGGFECKQGTSLAASIKACVQSNRIAQYMGTTSVARDMDVIRAVEGDSKLNYLGYSYGTVLGATYATLYPKQVGRMVLDSADDATFGTMIDDFQQHIAIAKAMVVLAQSCPSLLDQHKTPCAFTSEETLLGFLAKMRANPWRTTGGTGVAEESVFDWLTSVLYRGKLDRSFALQTISQAASGDQASIDALAKEAVGSDSPDSAKGSGSSSVDLAGTIVSCHSRPKHEDVDAFRAYVNKTSIPALLGGNDARGELINQGIGEAAACAGLPQEGESAMTKFTAPGSNPILIVSLTGDQATPNAGAHRLAEGLGNATIVDVDGVGHGVSFFDRSPCTDVAVTEYLDEGLVPKAGTRCDADF